MLDQAIDLIRSQTTPPPAVAIVLGSGLGGLADRIDAQNAISFEQIPGMATTSAAGHRGELIIGQLDSVPVVAMAGRLHRYEGWTHAQAVYPIRLMAALGAKRLIVSNAAGGVNPQLQVGEIVVIRDHINLIPNCTPTIEYSNHPPLGNPTARTTGLGGVGRHGNIYDKRMRRVAMQAAVNAGFAAREGTYLATLGPTYETRSEYRMMRRIGADVAGMSTVPEVLAAKEEDLRILGISMVSNVATPDIATKTDHQEVLEAGQAAETKMESIVRAVVQDEKAS
jgi:purine-nucleoside phosphorylase